MFSYRTGLLRFYRADGIKIGTIFFIEGVVFTGGDRILAKGFFFPDSISSRVFTGSILLSFAVCNIVVSTL